jgi:hypothetical protein
MTETKTPRDSELEATIAKAREDEFLRPLVDQYSGEINREDFRGRHGFHSGDLGPLGLLLAVKFSVVTSHDRFLGRLGDEERAMFRNKFADHYASGQPIIKEMFASPSFDHPWHLMDWLLERHQLGSAATQAAA